MDEPSNTMVKEVMQKRSNAAFDPGNLDVYLGTERNAELLTREQEATLSRQLARGRRRVTLAMASMPEGRAALLALAEQVNAGERPLHEVVNGSTRSHETAARLEAQAHELGVAAAAGESGDALVARVDEMELRWSVLADLARAVLDANEGPRSPRLIELSADLRAVERATATLVERNTRLVMSVARRYANRGMPLTDLYQEGCIGLLRAVELFDHRRQLKFSTYATWWIRQRVARALVEQGRTIRLPHHVHDTLRRARRAERQLNEADTETVADRIDVDADRLREIEQLRYDARSLETPVGEDATLGELLEDRNAELPSAKVQRHQLVGRIDAALAKALTPREADIIRQRFGLGDDETRTLEEVGQGYGLTRERIRQLEARALKKLGRSTHGRELRECLAALG